MAANGIKVNFNIRQLSLTPPPVSSLLSSLSVAENILEEVRAFKYFVLLIFNGFFRIF